jgi:hypothetical protein
MSEQCQSLALYSVGAPDDHVGVCMGPGVNFPRVLEAIPAPAPVSMLGLLVGY